MTAPLCHNPKTAELSDKNRRIIFILTFKNLHLPSYSQYPRRNSLVRIISRRGLIDPRLTSTIY